jgi:hypothetical protein
MHSVTLSLLVLCLTVVSVPAMAQQQILYDNGPVNGQVNAWLINFGNAVTDSFQNNNNLLLSEVSFYVWLYPDDFITQIDVSIGSAPYGSDLYHSTVQGPEQGNCFTNKFGYYVCLVSFSTYFLNVYGTAWLTLQNANVPSGNPVYWDQNSGVGCTSQGCPSKAAEKGLGIPPSALIPSEAFTIYGEMEADGTSTTDTTH